MKALTLFSFETAIFCFVAIAAYGQQEAPAPDYRIGEFWQFDIKESRASSTSRALKGIYQASFTGKTFKISEADVKESFDRTHAQAGRLLAMFGQGNYYGGQYLKFPLAVGQKWELNYTDQPTGARRKELLHVYAEVPGIEEVTTPAGTFRTFKLVRTIVRGGERRTNTFYYSPETKCIVEAKYEFGDGTATIELVKFGTR